MPSATRATRSATITTSGRPSAFLTMRVTRPAGSATAREAGLPRPAGPGSGRRRARLSPHPRRTLARARPPGPRAWCPRPARATAPRRRGSQPRTRTPPRRAPRPRPPPRAIPSPRASGAARPCSPAPRLPRFEDRRRSEVPLVLQPALAVLDRLALVARVPLQVALLGVHARVARGLPDRVSPVRHRALALRVVRRLLRLGHVIARGDLLLAGLGERLGRLGDRLGRLGERLGRLVATAPAAGDQNAAGYQQQSEPHGVSLTADWVASNRVHARPI